MIPGRRDTPVNFALIGCGRISQTYLEAMAALSECHLKGVADIRTKAAESAANQFGCKAYTDYQQLLDENHHQCCLPRVQCEWFFTKHMDTMTKKEHCNLGVTPGRRTNHNRLKVILVQ